MDSLLKPLLKSLLVEHEENEAKDLEETLNDILGFKSKNQSLLSLKFGFNVPKKEEAVGDYKLGRDPKRRKNLTRIRDKG